MSEEDDDSIIDERLDAVRVHIVGTDVHTEQLATEYGSWNTYQVSGAAGERPVPILPQNPRRNRAIIVIQPSPTNTTTGSVILGTVGQTSQHQGAMYVCGQQIVVESSSAVYAVGDGLGDILQISVHDELYRAVT